MLKPPHGSRNQTFFCDFLGLLVCLVLIFCLGLLGLLGVLVCFVLLFCLAFLTFLDVF